MVSIIIPAYNCAATILNTMKSIEKQNYQNYEIIIVDDGSTDATKDVVLKYKEKCKHKIVFVTQPNGGPGSARNKGLEFAAGKYIVFIDSDDFIADNYLSILVESIENGVDYCFGQYYKITDNKLDSKKIIGSEFYGIHSAERIFSSFICNKTHISLWNSLFIKKIIDDGNLRFKNSYSGEDVEFISRYLMECNTVLSIESPIYYFSFNSQRAKNRNLKNSISNIEESIYWPLLSELESKKWNLGYGALAMGKLPVNAILEIVNKAKLHNSYINFKNSYGNLLTVACRIDKKYVPTKTYEKCKLLSMCALRFPRIFFQLAKHI